jgi:hypothetical protein
LLTFFSYVIAGLAEDLDESTKDGDGKCGLAKLTTNTLLTSAYGLTNNGALYG